jgi:hypothetical protein
MINRNLAFYSVAFFLLSLGGCDTFVATEGSAGLAQKFVEGEMDNWMAGISSQAKDRALSLGEFIIQKPLSYTIKSVTPSSTKVMVLDGLAILDSSKGDPVYRVVVSVDFESRGQSTVSKIVEYPIAWEKTKSKWHFALRTE